MLQGVIFVAINVTNLERSMEFYGKLGFDVGEPFEFSGEWTTLLDMPPNARGKASIMAMEGSPTTLEVVEWLEPRTEGKPYPTHNHCGITRVHLKTTDIWADYERLKAAGVNFLSEPQEFPGGVNESGVTRWVQFRDPDGSLLELLEA